MTSYTEAPLMPRPHFAAITSAQHTALRRLRQDAALTPAERDRVEVILRSQQGESLRGLAADLEYSYETVRLWLQAWRVQGLDCVRHRPTGPPPDHARRRQVTAAQLAQALAAEHQIQLSARQCRKYLQAMGATWRRTQASLQHQQDPQRVAQARAELQALTKSPETEPFSSSA